MHVSEIEVRRGRQDAERQLATLRQMGTVEIVDDVAGVFLTVRFTPLAPSEGTFDGDDWGAVRERTEIIIDPLRLIDRTGEIHGQQS
jgi:hypothetical protein